MMRDHTLEPPCTEPKTAICTMCHDAVPEHDFSQFSGVCSDCEGDYLNARAKELAPEFIAAHKEAFYLSWWWNYLPLEERIAIAKAAYEREKLVQKHIAPAAYQEMCKDEISFCEEHRAFPEFAGAS